MDKGKEFAREVSETLKNEHGIKWKITVLPVVIRKQTP